MNQPVGRHREELPLHEEDVADLDRADLFGMSIRVRIGLGLGLGSSEP